MYNTRTYLREPSKPFPLALWIAGGIVIVMLVGAGTYAYADENDPVASANVSSTDSSNTPTDILWMSGGIGGDAREAMRKAAPSYNVHLAFQDRQGHYLASVPYTLQHQGLEIHSGVTEGPLLYLKLPQGSYQINAELNGTWQHKRFVVGQDGRTIKAAFVARNE